jgi:2'-5' RNA ligase
MNTIATQRLFFALWPNDKIRHSIVEQFKQLPKPLNGRIIQPQNLHITLHFIGSVNTDIQSCMQKAAATVYAQSFMIDLDCFGYFTRSKTLWMGSKDTPVALTDLYNELAERLTDCDYLAEKRPFKPHITLIRKCTQSKFPEDDFSIAWPINSFALVKSHINQHGANYQLIETYPLSARR